MKCAKDVTVEYVKFLAQTLGVCEASCVVLTVLLQLGIPVNYDGFEYLRLAILFAYEEPLDNLSGDIYPKIAEACQNKMGSEQIEISIRNAIKIAWDYRDENVWKTFFPVLPYKHMKKPTNSEFIYGIAKIAELCYKCALSYERQLVKKEVGNGV